MAPLTEPGQVAGMAMARALVSRITKHAGKRYSTTRSRRSIGHPPQK
jgi:hypothetical protein